MHYLGQQGITIGVSCSGNWGQKMIVSHSREFSTKQIIRVMYLYYHSLLLVKNHSE